MSEPFVAAEFRQGGPVLDMGRPIERAGFEQVLARVREQRLCRNRGDTVAGIDAVSAPVFDQEGAIVMVMTIMGARGASTSRSIRRRSGCWCARATNSP